MSIETYRVISLALSGFGLLVGGMLFVVAIWRDELKLKLLRPKLKLEAFDLPHGDRTFLTNKISARSRVDDFPTFPQITCDGHDNASSHQKGIDAIYWHVRVLNEKPWIIAEDVELFLVELSIDPERSHFRPLNGALAFEGQRHRNEVDVGYKSNVFNFLRFRGDQGFELLLSDHTPNNLNTRLGEAGTIEATVQAVGVNGVSEQLKILITWNGKHDIESLTNDSVSFERKVTSSRIKPKSDGAIW